MAKTRLTQEKRNGIHTYMIQKWDDKNYTPVKKMLYKALAAANESIRKKYPDSDMAVLQKYSLTRKDLCLKFVRNGSSDVFGINFEREFKNDLVTVPYNGGCRSDTILEISANGEKAIKSYIEAQEKYDQQKDVKFKEYRSFLEVCRYVEEVEDVVPLDEEMRKRYYSGAPLVAVNPELVDQIRKEFK